ncbi:hydrogenase maturation protease [Thioflexithrix psekupsensis]|uniref:Peptidase M52 n=1 Tax=Thioflexithrix psekupsensis TaxID=1570016 RepID=A0A251X7C8_9GAMM|nr:hydrogenase maturation protease [Thioflexithrix psekupsensis]OUD13845.1 peptidase M52 [Thioflexithrix psekupsensis]
MKTLILGIGNILLSDEGVGIHLLRDMEKNYNLPHVTWLDGGTLSFTLAPEIENHEALLVLDAAQLNAPPGSLRRYVGAEMDRFLNTHQRGVHEVGLMDVLTIVTLTERLPRYRALIGIQAENLTWGEELSPAVAAALPAASALVMQTLTEWETL